MGIMNSSAKAVVTKIDLGFAQVEGLILPDGSYAIALPQIVKLFQILQSNAQRDIKRILGEDFRFIQSRSELNPRPVNIVKLEDFKKIIRALDKKGNEVAPAFMDAILEEGLERRFDHAFNIKVSEQERNARLELRVTRLLARKLWTDTLMNHHLKLTGVKPTPEQYRKWTVIVNKHLFNKPHFNCDRDNMESEEQLIINQFEFMAVRVCQKYPRLDCDSIVQKALETF